MALSLKTTFNIIDPLGEVAEFKDITGAYSLSNLGGYGTPNPGYNNVEGVRFKFATYDTIAAATNPPTSGFVQYKEYLKIGGVPQVLNGVSYSVGALFVPLISGIAVGSSTDWIETGYIVIVSKAPLQSTPSAWKPTSNSLPRFLTPTDLGQTGSTVADGIYSYSYEVYVDIDEADNAAVVGQVYLVVSPGGAGTITINGNTYAAGSSFTATSTNILVAVGDAECYKLNAVQSGYSVLSYSLEYSLLNLISECDCTDVYEIIARLNALKMAAYMNNISMEDANNVFTDLVNKVQQKLECCC